MTAFFKDPARKGGRGPLLPNWASIFSQEVPHEQKTRVPLWEGALLDSRGPSHRVFPTVSHRFPPFPPVSTLSCVDVRVFILEEEKNFILRNACTGPNWFSFAGSGISRPKENTAIPASRFPEVQSSRMEKAQTVFVRAVV